MERRRFGKTGLAVSAIGYGAAPAGTLGLPADDVGALVNELLDAGINVIDTAAIYGGAEENLGKTVSPRRNQFVLISKCGQAQPDLPGEAWSPELITATVDRALHRLRTDHLDVMLLHSCDLAVLERGEALEALVRARQAGKVRFVGYSGDNKEAAYAASLADVAVIEMSVNICDQANIDHALRVARDRDVGVIAKRPLANTAWRPLSDQVGFYQEYARPYHERFLAMGLRAEELGFAAGDWPEIALRFALSHGGIGTAIIGTTKRENARKNLIAAQKGPLSDEVLRKLRAAFQKAETSSGKPWPGLT